MARDFSAWRDPAFDATAWLTGPAPFHYGTNTVGGDDDQSGGTVLADMLWVRMSRLQTEG